MAENQQKKNEDIKEFGQLELKENKNNHRIYMLTIIGEIEGHD